MKDNFGDRMKEYEGAEGQRRLIKMLPIIARMDGISFHNFTKGLARPYDIRFSNLMIEVTDWLMSHFGAQAAYTQSDEITLGWNLSSYNTEMFCGGRIQKLNSHLASKTSVKFNKLLPLYLPEKVGEEPAFDARVFNVPNLEEAANQFLWREQDASKNSISMAARAYFSHKEVDKKSGKEMQEMLFQKKGINWNNYPNFFKRGTFLLRRRMCTPYTTEELASLPEKHQARTNPSLIIERVKNVKFTELPKFSKIINRVDFLFKNSEPLLLENQTVTT